MCVCHVERFHSDSLQQCSGGECCCLSYIPPVALHCLHACYEPAFPRPVVFSILGAIANGINQGNLATGGIGGGAGTAFSNDNTGGNIVEAGNSADNTGRKLQTQVGEYPRGRFSRCRRLQNSSIAAQSSEGSLQHIRAALSCVCTCLVYCSMLMMSQQLFTLPRTVM